MYDTNYCITRLIFPYILPFLFGLLLFIFIESFDSTLLCDGEDIVKLKDDLNIEINKYDKIIVSYKYWRQYYSDVIKSPIPNIEMYNFTSDKVIEKARKAGEVYKNIYKLEQIIIKIDPCYKSGFKRYDFNKNMYI